MKVQIVGPALDATIEVSGNTTFLEVKKIVSGIMKPVEFRYIQLSFRNTKNLGNYMKFKQVGVQEGDEINIKLENNPIAREQYIEYMKSIGLEPHPDDFGDVSLEEYFIWKEEESMRNADEQASAGNLEKEEQGNAENKYDKKIPKKGITTIIKKKMFTSSEASKKKKEIKKRAREHAKTIEANYNLAMEKVPEFFDFYNNPEMLYIDVFINGCMVKAFIDTGAQATVMTKACARRCKLLHMVDKRFAGFALGVGTTGIMGRVHHAQIEIGSTTYNFKCSVLESHHKIDFLLGLDLLNICGSAVDIPNNCLIMGNDERIPFVKYTPLETLPNPFEHVFS